MNQLNIVTLQAAEESANDPVTPAVSLGLASVSFRFRCGLTRSFPCVGSHGVLNCSGK